MVVGCESSAHAISDITKNQSWQGWSRLPGDTLLCNLHAEQLKDPETEWLLVRGERALYVGDSLRNLNEYIVIGVEGLTGYGAAREFSRSDDDGHHIRLRVRRRGDHENDIVLVVPSHEVAKALKDWVGCIPSG
jgi:hypothetical protein